MENDNIINNKKIIKNNEEQNEQKDDIIYLKKLIKLCVNILLLKPFYIIK